MTTDITTVEMTIAEEKELAFRIDAIRYGIGTIKTAWREIGEHLAEIANGKLYRATHSTFEAFVKEEFNFSRQHAYRMIEAARIADVVSPMGDKTAIENPRQARALSGLDDQQARQVYEVAVAKTNGTPTAKAITEAKAEVTGGGRPAKPTAGSRMPTSKVYTDPNNFINALASHGESTVIQVDRLDWSRLDHDAIPEYLQNIKLTIAVLRKLQAQVTLAAQGGE